LVVDANEGRSAGLEMDVARTVLHGEGEEVFDNGRDGGHGDGRRMAAAPRTVEPNLVRLMLES
jgi:hypothetical protein